MHIIRRLIVISCLLSVPLASTLPAVAKPPGGRTATPAITAVVPVDTGRTVIDASGTFCEFDAQVTATWTQTSRLNVYPVISDVRNAPGELALKGAASRTVTVPFVLVPVGQSATFHAELLVMHRHSYQLVASGSADTVASCSR